jgi:predicted nucleic acid-binding protein
LIYHLNDVLPPAALASVEAWTSEGAMISVITRIEVLGYPQTDDQFQQAARLLAYFDEIPLYEPIVQRTITLRQQSRIRLPDALIAATALYLGVPLVTRNTYDFRAIEELIILNRTEMFSHFGNHHAHGNLQPKMEPLMSQEPHFGMAVYEKTSGNA